MEKTRDWLAELQTRVTGYLQDAAYGKDDGSRMSRNLNRILADVGTALVLAQRKAFRAGVTARGMTSDTDELEARGAYLYRLPARTLWVLREEPDPHGYAVHYRYDEGAREIMVRYDIERAQWIKASDLPEGYAYMLRPTADRIDLWASLKAEPYRTEEVPADESDPWPEVSP
jgi:hypothetical protein